MQEYAKYMKFIRTKKFDLKQIKYLIFQIKEQATSCPWHGWQNADISYPSHNQHN